MSTVDLSDRGKRLRQGIGSLFPEPVDERLRDTAIASLPVELQLLFCALPAFDQQHLIRVHAWLLNAGVADPDVLTAALLHDVGKQQGNRGVSTLDRTLRVTLRKLSPSLLESLARQGGPTILSGLSLAVHHPAIGAAIAHRHGCSERVCWLIAHHEDVAPIEDKGLLLLQAADANA